MIMVGKTHQTRPSSEGCATTAVAALALLMVLTFWTAAATSKRRQ